MPAKLEWIRNIGIIAHIDAGKTTTTERILFYAGASHRMGDVDDGTTVTDFDPEEQQRGITIYSAAITCRWKDWHINLIDTPGHVDFTAEVERSLRVLDGGVVVFSAREGVEAQSETVWRQANKYGVPRICYINKMDRIGANFERTLDQIRDRLQGNPVPVVIPLGEGAPSEPDPFRGIIDLVEMKALLFDSATQGSRIDAVEIPEDYRELAQLWRGRLIEQLALLDDALLEKYLEEQPIEPAELRRLLRQGTLQRQLQPVFCGSSLNYIGVQPVLDGVGAYLPSPADRPAVTGMRPGAKKETVETRKPSADEPFCGLIFKIQADAHGDLCFVRVYSGVLKSRARVLNPRIGKKELVNQLWHIHADRREKIPAESVEAGDIVGIAGLKDTVTGDTLCEGNHPIALESITFPEPVISMAVEPESSADRRKLAETLTLLSRQDPTFRAVVNEETGQTIISGMGELHLEIIRNRMTRDFKLNVRVHKPRVSYRETIRNPRKVKGEFSRQVAGVMQSARVELELEPYQGDEPIAVVNRLSPSDLSPALQQVIEQAIRDGAQGAGLLGYPLIQVRFTIRDVSMTELENPEAAFQAATLDGVHQGVSEDNLVLLEPIMRLEVTTPDEFMGNIHSDLMSRRALITGTEQRGELQVIHAETPLATMFGYSTHVRSLSQGRASYSMEPSRYAEAPAEVLREMLG
ncbi:MAG TPA: elongation factor G [Planctomycetaceae bacterium]|jgi:elongation factor G|nr:elongation factor G [Planctomycetaceae bacterium]